jgi:hypothetical protein
MIMQRFNNLSSLQKKNVIAGSIFGVMLIAVLALAWYNHRPVAALDYSMELSGQTALESHMLIGGDVYWGRRLHDWSQQSSLKEKYPFSRLQEFEREKYDAWIANLECPSVPGVKQDIGFVPELWGFNCDSDYVPEFANWYDIVSLANNHTSNQGRESGQGETRKVLDANDIQHFGGFNPHVAEDVCDVVALPARAKIGGEQKEVKIPVAMCGYHGVYYTITDQAINRMKEYAKYMPVIAYPHMGREYQATADEERRTLYRKMIDAGADAVIGNHPHWVQVTEEYKGKLIVYSMGNLIFDQQFSPEVMRSAQIDAIMSVAASDTNDEQLRAWTELGNTCTTFQDNCLAMAKEKNLPRLPITLKYGVVGVDLSGQITHRANQRMLDDILVRMNWADTEAKLTREVLRGAN